MYTDRNRKMLVVFIVKKNTIFKQKQRSMYVASVGSIIYTQSLVATCVSERNDEVK